MWWGLAIIGAQSGFLQHCLKGHLGHGFDGSTKFLISFFYVYNNFLKTLTSETRPKNSEKNGIAIQQLVCLCLIQPKRLDFFLHKVHFLYSSRALKISDLAPPYRLTEGVRLLTCPLYLVVDVSTFNTSGDRNFIIVSVGSLPRVASS